MESDLAIIVASLRQMINHHNSWTHRLPPEIIATVASHLEHDASLVVATHVCHLWRTTLLSSPRIWSHLDFEYEERALAFLERSKSAPLTVNLIYADGPSEIVSELLNEIAIRVTTLWARHGPFLDELLARPTPILEVLEVTTVSNPMKPTHLPSLRSLTIHGFDPLKFRAPLLTSFRVTAASPEWTTGTLTNFFRNCPLLDAVSLSCDVHPDSGEVAGLPILRSFTHESPCNKYQLYLFDRLLLPPTCRVVLGIDVTKRLSIPWIPGLPTPRDSSYLSDIKTIKISAHSRTLNSRERHTMFRTELVNSKQQAISFDRMSYYSYVPSDFLSQDLLGIFENIEIGSVETLCFNHYPNRDFTLSFATSATAQELRKFQNLKTLVFAECNSIMLLDGASSFPTVDTLIIYSRHDGNSIGTATQVQEFAASWKKVGYPLKTVTLVYPFAKPPPSELEELISCVGSVRVVSGDDTLSWDIDKYPLGTAAHGDIFNRS